MLGWLSARGATMIAETRHLGVIDLAGVEVGVLCVQEQGGAGSL